jgi:thiosulfate/3-mercaptopyruvate sulfurtransferase
MAEPVYKTILSPQVLSLHLEDPGWVIIDCRFDLQKPGWGAESYLESHIPSALYAHLDHDLSGPVTPETGRHPLPDIHALVERLESWGIGNNTQVAAYDTSGGAYAVRLWWLLRFLGHDRAAVLDGGFSAWQSAGLPVRSGPETRPRESFTPTPDWSLVVSAEEVETIRLDPVYRLVDARTGERYRGEREPIDPVAGHIPGAVNRFHGDNLDEKGRFLPPSILQDQFTQLIGQTPPEHVVVYCGSGVTSCHHILAMEMAGLSGARLYAGSWSEWIRGGKRPISTTGHIV